MQWDLCVCTSVCMFTYFASINSPMLIAADKITFSLSLSHNHHPAFLMPLMMLSGRHLAMEINRNQTSKSQLK